MQQPGENNCGSEACSVTPLIRPDWSKIPDATLRGLVHQPTTHVTTEVQENNVTGTYSSTDRHTFLSMWCSRTVKSSSNHFILLGYHWATIEEDMDGESDNSDISDVEVD